MSQLATICAAGMVSSLGHDLVTSCSAARAGLTRTSPIPCQTLTSEKEPVFGTGHTVFGLTDGFSGDARLKLLLAQALRDVSQTVSADSLLRDAQWFLSLPPSNRPMSLLHLMADTQRSHYEQEHQQNARQGSLASRAQDIADFAVQQVVSVGDFTINTASAEGAVGFAASLDAAVKRIEANEVALAVVAAVDSLVDERTLTWLQATGRLKSAEQPVGLMPGEAAVVLVLASTDTASQMSLPPLAHMTAVSYATSESVLGGEEPPDGRARAETLTALARHEAGVSDRPWVVSDESGEVFKATEWGGALNRLVEDHPQYQQPNVWYPAMWFGDTGAASSAVATASVLRAYLRGYAPAEKAAILCSSDGGKRAAFLVNKARA